VTRERRESPRAKVRRRPQRASLTGVLESVVGSLGANGEKSVVRLLAAIRELDVAAFVADDHGQLIATNAAASRLTGYTERELRRLSVYDITGEGDVETMDVLWKAFVQQRSQRGRYQIRRKSGRLILAEYAAARVATGVHLSLLKRVPRARFHQD
jgi:PAS domain S-box-containing protein